MLLFRSEGHVDRWLRRRRLARGATMSPEQQWRLAEAWYRTRLNPDWRRKTPEVAQATLASVGLTGPFWHLTGEPGGFAPPSD